VITPGILMLYFRSESRQPVARWPLLRVKTRRFKIVLRPPPYGMPARLTPPVGSLLRLHLLQHSEQPLVVDDMLGCSVWISSISLKPSAMPLN
jgi:hypothetical protein